MRQPSCLLVAFTLAVSERPASAGLFAMQVLCKQERYCTSSRERCHGGAGLRESSICIAKALKSDAAHP